RRHADHLVALHFRLERTTDAAIGAGGQHAVLRLAVLDDRLFHQCRGRAGLHAGAAGHAFGIEKVFRHAGRDLGVEASPLDRQRESALDLVTGADASRAHDALGRVEGEIGVAVVDRLEQVILAVEAVANLAQTHRARHVLQFAIAIGGAGQAIERVIGDVEFHDIAAQLRERGRLRPDLHARLDRRGTGCRVAFPSLYFHQAQPAGAERLEAV